MRFTDNVIALVPRTYEPNRLQQEDGVRASGTLYGISEHQQAEKSQQWLAMIVESSSEAIIGKSLEGVILSWNQAAERLFGYPAAAVIDRPLSILFPTDGGEQVLSLLKRSSQGKYVEGYETAGVRQDGQQLCLSLTLSPIKNKSGAIVGVAMIARDITERKRTEDRLQHLAFHDALTGLPNRFLFRESANQALTQARRYDHQVALLFIDLDRFKQINDSLGHRIGDRLLQVTASRLRRCLREGDAIARMGGDEFVVSLAALTDRRDAFLIAGKILDALREPFRVGNEELNVSGSIGIGIYPTDGQDLDTLLDAADTAMYEAKKKGRGNYQAASHAT